MWQPKAKGGADGEVTRVRSHPINTNFAVVTSLDDDVEKTAGEMTDPKTKAKDTPTEGDKPGDEKLQGKDTAGNGHVQRQDSQHPESNLDSQWSLGYFRL